MITDFEIVDLGVHHPDYFQGFGTSYTRFNNSVYGIGSTAQEAYDDALDQMAVMWSIAGLPTLCPFSGATTVPPDDTGMNDDYNQTYYHVGIRWNV